MQRDLRRLADTTFDLVVVGAGIYGALAAWDAARRGLTVAVVDRGDFGGATSFNSHKTLHGGLRSLQALNLRQMRLFVRERRAMAEMAPHLVRPLPYCVPTCRHPTRNAAALRVALAVTDLVAADRNAGIVDAELRLPRGRMVSRTECLTLNPLIDPDGVTGGAVWVDYQMRQPERVVLGAIRSAVHAGATAANYVEAGALVRGGGRIAAVTLEDRLTGTRFDVRTRAVLNATGPWAASVAAALAPDAAAAPAAWLSRAMNLVVDRVTLTHACGGSAQGRFLFLVPWRDVSILGTSHDPHDGGPDAPHGTPEHVARLLADGRTAFPRADLDPSRVRLVHRGLLPMVAATPQGVALLKESAVVDHAAAGCAGLVSIFSVRYTTARHTAAQAVDAVCRALGTAASAPGDVARMADAAYATLDELRRDARNAAAPHTDAALRERLAGSYGSAWLDVAALIADVPGLARPLSDTCAVTRAEVVHAVREECALTLTDALLRRTEAGTAGHPGAAAVDVAAGVMAAELGWSADRLDAERASLEAVYPRL